MCAARTCEEFLETGQPDVILGFGSHCGESCVLQRDGGAKPKSIVNAIYDGHTTGLIPFDAMHGGMRCFPKMSGCGSQELPHEQHHSMDPRSVLRSYKIRKGFALAFGCHVCNHCYSTPDVLRRLGILRLLTGSVAEKLNDRPIAMIRGPSFCKCRSSVRH